jgi:hypothetical protein
MRAYRFKHLVYIPIYKNAATSYEVLFGNVLNWPTFLSEDIDWSNDTVFAHISNPYERHLRGTTQFLYQNQLTSVIDDPRFEKFLSSGYFDHHSYPLTLMFGDNIKKIKWLPLDHPTIQSNTITCSFLQEHGIVITEDQIPNMNVSSPDQKNILDRIRKICEKHHYMSTGLFFMLDDDQVWYNKVINNIGDQ